MVLKEFYSAVSDGNYSAFLDKFGGLSFEESVDGGSAICYNSSNKGLEAIVGFDFFSFDDFDVNVISASGIKKITDLNELRLSEGHNVEN